MFEKMECTPNNEALFESVQNDKPASEYYHIQCPRSQTVSI